MKTEDFTTTITVDQPPDVVFRAVTNIRGWWSGAIEGSTDRLGAEFEYRYEDLHHSTQKVTEFVPGQRLVWHVTRSRIAFVSEKSEWTGTDIVFEIARRNGRTELRFTHVGLKPALQCYRGCSGAWGHYIRESLYDLITTGTGRAVAPAG